MFLDLGAPGAGVRVRVVGRVGDWGGDEGFVEEGEVPSGEVDEVQVGSREWCGVRARCGGGGVAALNGFGHIGCCLRTGATNRGLSPSRVQRRMP